MEAACAVRRDWFNIANMASALEWLPGALEQLHRHALKRTLTERTGPQRAGSVCIDGRKLVNFGSNDYLGLAADERIAEAARQAIGEYGWGSGASPLVTGRTRLQAELERKLAEFSRPNETGTIFQSENGA